MRLDDEKNKEDQGVRPLFSLGQTLRIYKKNKNFGKWFEQNVTVEILWFLKLLQICLVRSTSWSGCVARRSTCSSTQRSSLP